jgi:hypothetical protein
MKKRLLAIAAILVAIVGAIVFALAILPARAVTKANFDRLEIGMPQSKVESIFGGISAKELFVRVNGGMAFVEFDGPRQQAWQGADGIAIVSFNEKGHIIDKTWHEQSTSLWQRLQRWLP